MIAVQSYSASVAVGGRGHVVFQFANAAAAVVLFQARLNGQVVGAVPAVEVPGLDLRDLEGLGFSVPRVPGAYALTLYAKDAAGCETVTTVPRTVTIQ